jgi:hypothetical protein
MPGNRFQIILFLQMLQRSLDMTVGRMPNARDGLPTLPTMDRHISAAGTRFRLLACGMSLLQVPPRDPFRS